LAGRLANAVEAAGQAVALARQYKERGSEAWSLRLLGEIAARADPPDVEPAEDHYRPALTLAEELGMRPPVAHCRPGLGPLQRRQFVVGTAGGALGLLASCTSRPAQGQPSSTVPRIGYLSAAPADYPAPPGARHAEAFRQGLEQLGYVEGENVHVEYRFAD